MTEPIVECSCCQEQRRLEVLSETGRQLTIRCRVCRGQTIVTRTTCIECAASADEPHRDACSFAAPWGV
jgi:hypothetical protein